MGFGNFQKRFPGDFLHRERCSKTEEIPHYPGLILQLGALCIAEVLKHFPCSLVQVAPMLRTQ